MRFVIFALLFLSAARSANAEKFDVWIGMSAPRGGEKEGIYRASLDSETGALTKPELAVEIASPGFLAVAADGSRLYSVCTLPDDGGGVAAFDIEGGELRPINMQPTGDGEACHITLDPTGKSLFTAQYGTGSICAYPLQADGKIGTRTAHVRHTGTGPNRTRQEGPHPHYVTTDPTNQYLLVPDLGSDQVIIYRTDLDAAQITPHGAGRVPAGGGPRHMKFHPNGKFAYVLNELGLAVTAFLYDEKAGTLTEIETVTTLPENLREVPCTGSEIRMHPSGKFIYTANRGHDSIAAFKVDADNGKLKFIELESIRGSHPRNFNIDPTGKWLLVACRDTNNITVFRIDEKTGGLVHTGTTVGSPQPICIEFSRSAS
jgi:6-phosphogluconolactonase